MEPKWINDGEPDENGDIVATIENPGGGRVSTFKGKSVREVADKVLQSQIEATKTISRLMRPDSGRKPFKAERKELTPDDKFRLAGEITDPNKVVDAVTEIVTAQQGIAPDVAGKQIEAMDGPASAAYYQQEADSFRKDNPEYYPDDKNINMKSLFDELEAKGWDFTRNNLSIVFQTLSAQGKMLPWPEGDEDEVEAVTPIRKTNGTSEPNPPSPSSRPRSISSGIRGSDASGTPPPTPRPAKITRADIEKMPRREWEEKLRDPAFRRLVDAMA
jgi:hypothetical protein